MIKLSPRVPVLAAALFMASGILSSQIAFGAASAVVESDLPGLPTQLPQTTKLQEEAETQAAPAAPGAQAVLGTQAAPATPKTPETFTSNGTPLQIASLGISITPPAGWEVTENGGSLSVVMKEPADSRPSYDKPKYQRNITVAAINHASPIDEKRAQELQSELIKSFGSDASVSNFQIIEHRFFNYRGTNDGLLVYSSLDVGGFPMMQMHVLVSGQDKQFLMTYTDLASRFTDTAKGGAFDTAWQSMASIDVMGSAPARPNPYVRYGVPSLVVLLLGLVVLLFKRRKGRADYAGEADQLMDMGDDGSASPSLFATLAGGWRLDEDEAKGEAVSGLEFTGLAPRTREAKYATNY